MSVERRPGGDRIQPNSGCSQTGIPERFTIRCGRGCNGRYLRVRQHQRDMKNAAGAPVYGSGPMAGRSRPGGEVQSHHPRPNPAPGRGRSPDAEIAPRADRRSSTPDCGPFSARGEAVLRVLAATKNTGVRPVSSRFAAIRIPVPRPSSAVRVGGLFSAGVRRVVMLVVPPVWMGLR
jgi:hypothetical protein